jgi:hypothetical protein
MSSLGSLSDDEAPRRHSARRENPCLVTANGPLAFMLIGLGVALMLTILFAPLGAVMVAAGIKLLWPRM